MMTDCHYYFGDYEFDSPLQTLYVVGGKFPTFPGRYLLPCR